MPEARTTSDPFQFIYLFFILYVLFIRVVRSILFNFSKKKTRVISILSNNSRTFIRYVKSQLIVMELGQNSEIEQRLLYIDMLLCNREGKKWIDIGSLEVRFVILHRRQIHAHRRERENRKRTRESIGIIAREIRHGL